MIIINNKHKYIYLSDSTFVWPLPIKNNNKTPQDARFCFKDKTLTGRLDFLCQKHVLQCPSTVYIE